jgi:hypothetical protein
MSSLSYALVRPLLTSVTIPNSVKEIGHETFPEHTKIIRQKSPTPYMKHKSTPEMLCCTYVAT